MSACKPCASWFECVELSRIANAPWDLRFPHAGAECEFYEREPGADDDLKRDLAAWEEAASDE